MRITQSNIETLIDALNGVDESSEFQDLRSAAEEWQGLMDEPDNEDTREQKAEARETISTIIDDGTLAGSLRDLLNILEPNKGNT